MKIKKSSSKITILFKIIARMKLFFSNYLGDYSYSFQGSFELTRITVTVSLFSSRMQLQEIIPLRDFPEFLQLQLHDLMVFEFKM